LNLGAINWIDLKSIIIINNGINIKNIENLKKNFLLNFNDINFGIKNENISIYAKKDWEIKIIIIERKESFFSFKYSELIIRK
jgi:hypothetical protein